MMTQNNMLEWDQLSMKQRAAFIRNAVARGIYNVEDIVQDYNEFRKGGPIETPIYEDLPKMLRKAGLDIKVTSGYRPAGTVGNAGQRSWHHRHGAVDIVPQGNTTFEDIENVLHNNPAIRQYMLSHNFGLIDESGRTAESKATMKKTGATGAHFHIGKDSKYAALYRQRVGAAQPEGDRGKTVYFTNPFLPLEQPTQQAQIQRTVTPEDILQNVTIPEPIKPDEDIQVTAEIPEVEVIGHQPQVNPLTILSQIQESAPTPLVLEPYQIPQIQNKVNEIATQRNSFLQKDLEDRLLAEERRRRLGYSYRDNSIEDDIKQMQFLRNMSANGGNLYDEGGGTNQLAPWLALNNIDYEVIPDTTFTRDKTGAGSIEYFSAEYPEGITYPNGYHKTHPIPGKDVILFNPNDNDAQDIRLDALHIMPKDATYDALNTLYRDAALNSDVAYNAKLRYEEDAKKYGKENIDSYEQYFNNEADGLLRNMFIEGTPEYIQSKRYYPNKAELRGWNNQLLPYIDAIQNYLETGQRPTNVLPEVVVTGNRHNNGGALNILLDTNSYGGGGGLIPGINIPVVAKNLYNKAKDRLYRTITPQGYHLGRAAKEFIKGDTRDFTKFTPAENEVWARYLGVPYDGESSFEKAIYTPTKGGATYDDVIKFKDESQILSDDAIRQLLQNQMLTGKNTLLVKGNESGLGTYTLSLGEDENGKYISYYDDWDINPTRGLSAKYKIPLLDQIGDVVPKSNPFTVYGRRYYTDDDLRRIIER